MNRSHCAQAVLLLSLAVGLAGCFWPSGPDLHMTLQVSADGAVPAGAALAEARDTIRKRLELSGYDNAVIETAGPDRLSVRVPGVEDRERVRRLVQSSTLLELRLIRYPAGDGTPSRESVLSHYNGQVPPDLEILDEEVRDEAGKVTETRTYAVEKRPVIAGRDIESARPTVSQFNQPVVEFELTPEAAEIFSDVTGANVGTLLAIVIDGRVVSAPRINSRIGKHGLIEGGFTREQALDLAIMLQAGPLPARLTVIEERVVGPEGT